MNQRPKIGETEEDLLKQQEEFLKVSGKESLYKREINQNVNDGLERFEILKDVVEKPIDSFKPERLHKFAQSKGFPKSFLINPSLSNKKKGKKSLFAMQLEKNAKNSPPDEELEKMEVNETSNSVNDIACPNSSNEIHEENLKKLSQMTESEIIEEQKKLLETLDPNLVAFLKNRKKEKVVPDKEGKTKMEVTMEKEDSNDGNEEEVKKNLEKYLDSKWINMDFIEKEKLEWIGDIPDKKSLEADQPYSARFDFKGKLQPFTTEIDVRNSLYHHGDEPNRPGYTIQELYQLSRSKILQQRILALNTLANIIRKTKLGYYDMCFDGQLLHKLVESDLFFLLRFSIDDKCLVPSSVFCLYYLLCNESDEFCLDKLLGLTYRDKQPLIFDKMETTKNEENELKDHVVISCDTIKGVIRTDLLIRLTYSVNNFSPNRETVIRVISCFVRIARHSLEAATKIFETKNLLELVYKKINTTAPIVEGVKLFRLIASLSEEFASKLIRKFDFKFLVSFIEAEENFNISKKEFYLLKLETIYFWRSLLLHDLFVNEFIMWSPCLIRLLLFYTQKVDVSSDRDFDFELFSALTSLIIVCNRKKISDSNVTVMMRICLEKWITQLIQRCSYNFSVSKAVGCAFGYFTSCFKIFGVETLDLEFIKKINALLVTFFQSKIFKDMVQGLQQNSHILSLTNVTRDPENLPSLCSVYLGGDEFLKIVQNSSSLPFFVRLVKYLKTVYGITHESKLVMKLFSDSCEIRNYIWKVCQCDVESHNWFVKYETSFLTNYLQILSIVEHSELLDVSFSLLPFLRVDDKNCKHVLKIIFDENSWRGKLDFLKNLDSLYSELLLQNGENVEVSNYKNSLVPEDWVYKVLTLMRGKEGIEAVTNVLKFISFILQTNSKLLDKVPFTFRYYHLCSVFLTDSNVFDSSIQSLLEEIFQNIVTNRHKVNLNKKLEKNKSFYDVYTELVTQYAGVSYGLPTFGKFVLFPLQNRFSVSFRKLIWFEYLHVLRVVTVSFPVDNFVELRDFVKPCETDESLLVAYLNSISNNVITKKKNPFVYYMAVGNLKTFLDSKNQEENLLMFLNKKMKQIKNEELINDIRNFKV